jgi:Na+-driven multidrug efflux pump
MYSDKDLKGKLIDKPRRKSEQPS